MNLRTIPCKASAGAVDIFRNAKLASQHIAEHAQARATASAPSHQARR